MIALGCSQRENLVVAKNRKSNIYLRPKTREKYLVRGGIKKRSEGGEGGGGGSGGGQYLFAVLLLRLPISLCSRLLADGGQSQITGAVVPAALLHTQSTRTHKRRERENTAVQHSHTHSGLVGCFFGGGGGMGGRTLTAPQTETQSSRVLRKLLGSNGCQ